jgi:hypothetical protein
MRCRMSACSPTMSAPRQDMSSVSGRRCSRCSLIVRRLRGLLYSKPGDALRAPSGIWPQPILRASLDAVDKAGQQPVRLAGGAGWPGRTRGRRSVAACPGRDQVSQRCAGIPARASQVWSGHQHYSRRQSRRPRSKCSARLNRRVPSVRQSGGSRAPLGSVLVTQRRRAAATTAAVVGSQG